MYLMYQSYANNLLDSAHATPKVINWVKHKRQPNIASGLNQYCSFMDPDLFDRTRQNRDAVLQTHFNTMFKKTRLTLLQAVKQ